MNDQIKFPDNFPMRLTGEEDIDKSQADIAEEIKPEPKTADGNKKIADKFLYDGQVHKAITRYKKAARMGNDANHRTDLGDAYAYAELPVNAIKQYRRAIKYEPTNPEPYFALAELLVRYGKWHSAIDEYLTAVELKPNSAYYRHKLASAYIKANEPLNAADQLVSAVECEPNDSFYRFELASLYADIGQNHEAVNEFEQAVALTPNDDYYHVRLAMLYVRIEDLESASNTMLRAININPQRKVYVYILAHIYRLLNDNNNADTLINAAGSLSRYDEDFLNRAEKYMQGDKW
jgi:Tfp pilus assembly protein PilF